MENLGVLISKSFFLSLASLREARQGISHSISLFQTIVNLEEVSREFLGPVDLTRAQTHHIYESAGVIRMTWSPDMAHNLIRVIPQSYEFSLPHRHHHPQASPKTSDLFVLQLHLGPRSLPKGLRSIISIKAVALEGATSYYAEGVTSYYAKGVISYYAKDGTLYHAEVGTSYYGWASSCTIGYW